MQLAAESRRIRSRTRQSASDLVRRSPVSAARVTAHDENPPAAAHGARHRAMTRTSRSARPGLPDSPRHRTSGRNRTIADIIIRQVIPRTNPRLASRLVPRVARRLNSRLNPELILRHAPRHPYPIAFARRDMTEFFPNSDRVPRDAFRHSAHDKSSYHANHRHRLCKFWFLNSLFSIARKHLPRSPHPWVNSCPSSWADAWPSSWANS